MDNKQNVEGYTCRCSNCEHWLEISNVCEQISSKANKIGQLYVSVSDP